MLGAVIPDECYILVCGIPAVGKSTLGRHLAQRDNFAHYDLESFPAGWPIPSLQPLWNTDRRRFVEALKEHHPRVILDWGFPVACLPIVDEIAAAGLKILWLDGDRNAARESYIRRGGQDVRAFDVQIQAITGATLPRARPFRVINALSTDGEYVLPQQLVTQMFAGGGALA